MSESQGQRNEFDPDDGMSDAQESSKTERFETHLKGSYFRK